MYQNFSLKQSMQIPHETAYVPLNVRNLDEEIENLSKNYEIHRSSEIKTFIKSNPELIQYINSITPLISSYFPDYKKCLTFCEDPEFDDLDCLSIYINSFKSNFEVDWKKLDEIDRKLCLVSDFSREITRLISVDLWFK